MPTTRYCMTWSFTVMLRYVVTSPYERRGVLVLPHRPNLHERLMLGETKDIDWLVTVDAIEAETIYLTVVDAA